jgi:uncharacterized protein YqhQ
LTIRDFLRLSAHIQMLPVLESGEETLVGGQAVMEGVMMRAPHSYCVAVRKANGEIVTDESPLPRVSEKYPIFKLPILRGLGTLGQAMGLGFKALRFSANAALDDRLATDPGKSVAPAKSVVAANLAEACTVDEPCESTQPGKPAANAKRKEMPGWLMWANLAFSLAFFIFLYKFVPLFAATQLGHRFPAIGGTLAINLMDGVIRLVLFLAFLFLLSRMKDIHRVFQYHGAEHKVVFNFESRQPLTVENAQKFVTWHPRCGTSFLIVVMLMALVVYALLPFQGFALKLASRIVLLPLIAGLSYEVIRFAAKRRASFLALLTTPGLWLQRITTQPPSDDQAAVAIHALEGAFALETKQGGELVIA